MSALHRPWHPTLRRAAGLLLLAGLSAAWLTAGLPARPAQDGEGQRKDADTGPGKKRKHVEEEEEGPAPPKPKVVRVEDEDEPKAAPARRPGTPPARDLGAAAREARHPQVRALFRGLAVPHDVVRFKGFTRVKADRGGRSEKEVWVEPIPVYVTDPKDLPKARLDVRVIDRSGNRVATESSPRDSIEGIRYYERIALEEVGGLLGAGLENRPQADPDHLSRYDQCVAAEQALAAVVRFHESAREREVRQGSGWDGVEKELRKQLLDVVLGELAELTKGKDWDGAFALTRRLVETYRREEEQQQLAGPVKELVRRAVKDPRFGEENRRELARQFRRLEEQYPRSPVLKPIRDSLRGQAKELLERAKALEKSNPGEALALVKQAEEADPHLSGLRTYRIELDQSFQVLKVGVRELPRYLSPGWACTDTELRGVELLFEGLVKASPDGSGAIHYELGLAEGRPKVIPLGREFQLPARVVWSDGEELSAADIRYTVEQLRNSHATGRPPVWGREPGIRVGFAGESSRVRLYLKRGYIDPLALMTFKVVPRRTGPKGRPATSPEFAESPVSSGPFRYRGVKDEPGAGRRYASFEANPDYGTRPSKQGRPLIKEVRFYRSRDPVHDLKVGLVDMALDLTAAEASALRKESGVMVALPRARTLNRRVYFLAVNHRKPALANANVRVALARAINREKLLDEHFRGPLGDAVHRALNGPYPAGSWACDPSLKRHPEDRTVDPYDADLARTKLGLAKGALDGVTLSLKYPKGDPALARALAGLCKQLADTLKVNVEPEALDPYALRNDVEVTHRYDLAYYHYDYPDETFWLMPLLGPNSREGRDNYLGYSGSLVDKVQESMGVRHFKQVKERTHAIHRELLEKEMPIIPLWQLDPLLAYRSGESERVEVVPFDPLLVFTDVDRWRVVRGGK